MTLAALGALVSACTTASAPRPSWEAIAAANPAPQVAAAGETDAVATANTDAADDPAIWRDSADPARSLIVGTDKKAGLYVYGLDGHQRDFIDAGRVNNVDLLSVSIGGQPGVLVAASDRNNVANAKVALFALDTATAKLRALGTVSGGVGEGYGMCLAPRTGSADAFIVMKDGTINQIALDLSGPAPTGRIVRTLKLATQSEGCVVDPRSNRLYVGEEDVGIWRFDASPEGSTTPVAVAKTDGRTLVADTEGLAILAVGDKGGWLIASSQGDNAYSVYRLSDDSYVGRFRIGPGRFGATSETDGIAALGGDFGSLYPGGLFIAQDGDNAPRAQNFKLVSWDAIRRALNLAD